MAGTAYSQDSSSSSIHVHSNPTVSSTPCQTARSPQAHPKASWEGAETGGDWLARDVSSWDSVSGYRANGTFFSTLLVAVRPGAPGPSCRPRKCELDVADEGHRPAELPGPPRLASLSNPRPTQERENRRTTPRPSGPIPQPPPPSVRTRSAIPRRVRSRIDPGAGSLDVEWDRRCL